jgi:hypothetical protein
MVGVASQIIFCIFAAAVIGSVAGYLIRGIRHAARIAEIERGWQTRLSTREQELEALRAAVGQHGATSNPSADAPALLQPKATGDAASSDIGSSLLPPKPADASQFESKLTDVLSLVEKLAKSQERMESELAALKSGGGNEFKLEPSQPKS